MNKDEVPSVNPKLDAMCEMLKTIHNLNERNKMLKAQIEKMVNEIDKTIVLSNIRECEICDIQDIFRKYGFKRNSNDIWEIKEK